MLPSRVIIFFQNAGTQDSELAQPYDGSAYGNTVPVRKAPKEILEYNPSILRDTAHEL